MNPDQSDTEARQRDWFLIQERLFEFGHAVDTKQFERLDRVFASEATGLYNGRVGHRTCAELIASMHENLGADSWCGASQHNVLNVRVEHVGPDELRSRANFYAVQQGVAEYEGLFWKTWGEYDDSWIRTADGWRIRERRYTTYFSEGPEEIVTPRRPRQDTP